MRRAHILALALSWFALGCSAGEGGASTPRAEGPPSPYPGGELYVVANGHPQASDANPGTEALPWRTLQHAADRLEPGDVLVVRAGSYQGFCALTGGTAESPITYWAEREEVILRETARCGDSYDVPDVVNLEGANFVVLDGFRVRDAERAGIRVVEAEGVVLRNNVVGPNGRWGIFSGFAPRLQLLDNVTFGSRLEHGIYVSNSRVADEAVLIRGNESYGNARSGIQLNGDCHAGGDGIIAGATIENNLLHDNDSKPLSLISVADSVVRNNLFYRNGLVNGAGGIHLTNEPGCAATQASRGVVVVNNTLVEPTIAGVRITDDAEGHVIFNNLVVSPKGIIDEVGRSDSASNLVTTVSDGLFVGPAADDYHLAAGSRAVDAGRADYQGAPAPQEDLEGAPRPQGAGVDLGAFERP